MRKTILALLCLACLLHDSIAQKPVRVTIDTSSRQFAIPPDFSGLGFETRSVVPNQYGASGYFFTPENTQLVTLFQNMGIRNIRVGGGTVDGSGQNERCVTPAPTEKDIDHLFDFARAAGIDVIYSVRLLNVDACPDPHLASEDAAIAKYVWNNYRPTVTSISIGNEPDVRQFHTYPGHPSDSAIFESAPGVAGSAYPSYLAEWRRFAAVILKSVPDAKFSGPDTAVSSTSSFTPDPTTGMSWTEKFSADLKGSGMLVEALQHHYVWGLPENTTPQEAIDDMLSRAWDDDLSAGKQPAKNGGRAEFHPYPFVYSKVLSTVVPMGIPYRMTEANDCLHGVSGASNGFAAALWALDYMHWWAAHHMAGVNFHNNPWLPTDTVVPDPNPCASTGCANYRITAKGYGLKAFDLGGHGYVMPVEITNPQEINLTAYAVGTGQDLFVTILNRTHASTRDVADAHVTIDAKGMKAATAAAMVLAGSEPGDATSMTASLGGAEITNHSRWLGKWSPLGPVENGHIAITVKSTTAVIVKIHAAGAHAGPVENNQDGALELVATEPDGAILFAKQTSGSDGGKPLWQGLPGDFVTGQDPAVVRNQDNTLEIFATAADGCVYHDRQRSPGGAWGQWSPLGAERISHLAAAQNADGSLSVFGIGANGELWTDSESAPGVGWTGWRGLGEKRIAPGYAAAQELSGRLKIFGVDDRGTVWQNAQTDSGEWSGWKSLGGRVGPYLAAGRNLDGRLELFGIGAGGRLERIAQAAPDGSWGSWAVLGGTKLQSGLAVGQYADGRLAIFAMGAGSRRGSAAAARGAREKTVWSIAQQQPGKAFGPWSSLGNVPGPLADSRLALANDSDGRMQLFALSTRNGIWTNRQLAAEDSPAVRSATDGISTSRMSAARMATSRISVGGSWSGWTKISLATGIKRACGLP